MGVENYVATFRLIPITDVDHTFAEWTAEFDAAPEREDGLVQSIGTNVFAAGLSSAEGALRAVDEGRYPPYDRDRCAGRGALGDPSRLQQSCWLASSGLKPARSKAAKPAIRSARARLQADGRIAHPRAAAAISPTRSESFGYCILEAPSPLRNYVAHVRLRPVTGERRLLVGMARLVRSARSRAGAAGPLRARRYHRGGLRRDAQFSARRARAARSSSPRLPAQLMRRAASRASRSCSRVTAARRFWKPAGREFASRAQAKRAFGRRRSASISSTSIVAAGASIWLRPAASPEWRRRASSRASDRTSRTSGPEIASPTPALRRAPMLRCATMRADLLVRLPEFLSDASAAALLLKGMTAGFLLHDVAQVKPASLILVHAAAGGVGQNSVPLGEGAWRCRDRRNVKRRRRPRKRAAPAATRSSFTAARISPAAVMRFTSGRGVDVVYDAVGKETFEPIGRVPRARPAISSASARLPAMSASIRSIGSPADR